jgi:hypothetical protein
MWIRLVLWICTIAIMVILFLLSSPLREADAASVEVFEMASESKAIEIIAAWKKSNLVDTVLRVIYVDYLFILFYVPLMIISSRDQLKLETNGLFCMLLTLSTPFAILTGVLDVIENLIMTQNITATDSHTSTVVISVIKFTAAGWVVLPWLFVISRRQIRK